jgi:hypothetical protein
MATIPCVATGNFNWSDGSAWQGGIPPGAGDIALIYYGTTAIATLTADTNVGIIQSQSNTFSVTIPFGFTLTHGSLYDPSIVSSFRCLNNGALIWAYGSPYNVRGAVALLNGSDGPVTINAHPTVTGYNASPHIWTETGAVISQLTLTGWFGISSNGVSVHDPSDIFDTTVNSLDVSGLTGQSALTGGSPTTKFTIPSGQTLVMPSTPAWLYVKYCDSSSGGAVYAPGGTDAGFNLNWVFTAPVTHATSGVIVGAGSTVAGSGDSGTARHSNGSLVGGSATISGSAHHRVYSNASFRSIEVFDERYQTDCTVPVIGDPNVPVASSDAFEVLTGKRVWLKGWDRFFGTLIVDSDGVLTMTSPGWRFFAGLPYACIAETMPIPTHPLENKSLSNISVRVNKMRGLRINDSEVTFLQQGSEVDMPPPEFTGQKETASIGADKDAAIKVVNELPYSGTILSIAGRLEIGES